MRSANYHHHNHSDDEHCFPKQWIHSVIRISATRTTARDFTVRSVFRKVFAPRLNGMRQRNEYQGTDTTRRRTLICLSLFKRKKKEVERNNMRSAVCAVSLHRMVGKYCHSRMDAPLNFIKMAKFFPLSGRRVNHTLSCKFHSTAAQDGNRGCIFWLCPSLNHVYIQ